MIFKDLINVITIYCLLFFFLIVVLIGLHGQEP